ncbi:uncharacterized protein [Prorops nasuta]|uniref:uncharacterized protein isoform X2 n=1 Tax=Prorops nasuta TaxID=863751 RepID=UPI0034CF5757
MFIYDIVHKKNVCNIITNDLKNYGVKYRFKKNSFQTNNEDLNKSNRQQNVFNAVLSVQRVDIVNLSSGGVVHVPQFVKEATNFLEKHLTQEGLFRKAGSQIRQKELVSIIEKGFPLPDKAYAIDVANLLKTFFRNLSEPLIPYTYHDLFVHCAMLKGHCVEALLLASMFLPTRHLQTLAFFMEFLKKVSTYEKHNKMTIDNLAKVITPNIMPLQETSMLTVETRLQLHLLVIKILIENAQNIGVLPDRISQIICNEAFSRDCEELVSSDADTHSKLKDKKHRSASLTRMFSGLKKIVGKNGSSDVLNEKENHQSMKKSQMTNSSSSKIAKKRKVIELPETLNVKKKKTPDKLEKSKKLRLSLDRFVQKSNKQRSTESEIGQNTYTERRWSSAGDSTSKKSSASPRMRQFERNKMSPFKTQDDYNDVLVDADINLSDDNNSELDLHASNSVNESRSINWSPTETRIRNRSVLDKDREQSMSRQNYDDTNEYVKVPKREYEEIKSRVSAIESRISEELDGIAMRKAHSSTAIFSHSVSKVQTEYEKTLEEASIEDTIKADNLAKRLGKELKIRRSSEHKIIRSPSARKIGTIRRRSQDKIVGGRITRRASWDSNSRNTSQIIQFNSDTLHQCDNVRMEYDSFCSDETNARLKYLQKQLRTLITHTTEHAGDSLSDESLNMVNESSSKISSVRRTSSLRSSNPKSEYFNKKVEQLKRAKSHQHLICKFDNEESNNKPSISSWKDADNYFKSTVIRSPVMSQTGRASIAKLRTQNAGMVLATANLFDTNRLKLKTSGVGTELKNCNNVKDSKPKKVAIRASWSKESNKIRILQDSKSLQPQSLHKLAMSNVSKRNQLGVNKNYKRNLGNVNNSVKERTDQKKTEVPPLSPTANNRQVKSTSLCRTPHIKKPLAKTPLILKTPKNCKTLGKHDNSMRSTPMKAVKLNSIMK